METDMMQSFNISFESPDTGNTTSNQLSTQPKNISESQLSQTLDFLKSSTPHSIADDNNRINLSSRKDDGLTGSTLKITRTPRRKSILEATLMEPSGTERIVSTAEHSISTVLNNNLNDFVKIIETVTEIEESLTENVLEINPMQSFLANAIKLNDSTHQRTPFKSITIKALKDDLDTAVGVIKGESGALSSKTQKAYHDKLEKIGDERRARIEPLKRLKNAIQTAQRNASDSEAKRNEEALKGFSLKIQTPILPKVPLKLDDIPFKEFNLVSDPPTQLGADEVPLDEKIKTLVEIIKAFEIQRTDSGIKKTWKADANIRMVDVESNGVLEMDSDSVRNLNGALEKSKALPVSQLPYSPEELKILYRMNSRRNFLKNPRFSKYSILPSLKNSSESLLDSNVIADQADGIYPEPPVVYFTDYEVGKEFSQILRIRNKTQHSHRFRLGPVSVNQYSQNFSYSLAKSPIQNDGLVAPGMSCTYDITFRPDSLADVTFMLSVSTELGNSFVVPICAQRKAPILTLPKSLHCGPCRAGFIAHRKWEFQNTGGPGRFMIIKGVENVDPYTMIKAIEDDLSPDEEVVFQDGPFEIYPAYFKMESLEKRVIHVTYTAKEIEFANKFEEIFEREDQIMVKVGCDNGQILEMPILAVAQTCRLEIVKFDPREKPIFFRKIENEDRKFELKFGEQNLFAVTSSFIIIKNKTQLKLPFRWIAYENPGDFGKITDTDLIPEVESIQIIPSKGWILPDSETLFEINFSPHKVKKYDILTTLMICTDLQKYECRQETKYEDPSIVIKCLGQGLDYNIDVSPPALLFADAIYALESFNTEIRLRNHSISKIAFEWLLENLDSSLLDIEMTQTSGTIPENETILIGIRIFTKFPGRLDGNLVCITGHGMGPEIKIPLRGDVRLRSSTISFDQPLVDFGLLALGNASTRLINMINTSNYSVSWDLIGLNREKEFNEKPDFFLKFDPCSGTLAPGEYREIEILFVPTWHQTFRGLIECRVSGIYLPGQEHLVPESLIPFTAAAIQMKAEVQTPQMHVLNPKNYVTCFIGVTFDWTVMLQNITMLPTKYRWIPVENPYFNVTYPDDGGVLAGKQLLEVTLRITFLNIGTFPDISLFLEVEDMLHDEGLVKIQLDATVCNIDVSVKTIGSKGVTSQAFTTRKLVGDECYKIPHIATAENQLTFDFGSDCPIFGTRLRSLVIQNMSSVQTSYRLWFENYTATIEDEQMNEITSSSSNLTSELELLKSTPRSKLGFSSKSGQSYIDNINKVRSMVQKMQALLKNGRGAAFNPTPNEGIIEPWGEKRIDIISYNNLVSILDLIIQVGNYEDNLHIEVGESIHETMGARLTVVGTAIKFTGAQLVSNKKNISGWIDRINFGSRIVNLNWKGSDGVRITSLAKTTNAGSDKTELFSKTINIENQSPRSVILNWRIYILYKSTSDQIGPGENLNTKTVINQSNLVKENDIGIFEVVPKTMTIAAFKTMPLKILFRSALVGTYNALALAEVAYLEPGGELRYAPVKPNTKAYEKSLAKIHIQSKVIEPRLTLEEMDVIRIKRKLKVQTPNDLDEFKTVNAFLKNNSDAICSFRIEALPTEFFTIKCSSKFIQPSSKVEGMFELKPTEQMLIAVSFKPSYEYDRISFHTEFEKPQDVVQILCKSGHLKITFSNDMVQTFPIEVCD